MYNLHFLALANYIYLVAVGPFLDNIFNKNFFNLRFKVNKAAYPPITRKTNYKPFYNISSKAYYSTSSKPDVAVFPLDSSIIYENSLKSRHDICFNYRDLRGVYLWTSKTTGKQYIGSSRNLSLRLAEYFREGYLTLQSGRGSVICRALLKYGHEDFSLSIISLGGSLENSKYYSDNLPDFVILEQNYLDRYPMEYDVNRVASSKYTSLRVSVNKGEVNPSYNLLGEEAFVWDRIHSEELKARWSKARGKISFFIYSRDSFELEVIFLSSNKLAAFLKINPAVIKQIRELIELSEHSAIRCKDFIITLKPIDSEILSNNLNALFNFDLDREKLEKKKGRRNITIYGFNPETQEYKIWLSKGECLEELTGYCHTNVRTINRRIDKDILYKGYYLQTKPFRDTPENN